MTAPYAPVVIGADIGNATVVVARPDKVAAFFPSVVTSFGVRAYEGLSRVAGTTRHHIDYGDTHAVIGVDAFEMPGADTLLAEYGDEAHRRYTDENSFLCFLAGVSAAFPDVDTVGVRLATGAPLSIYEAYGGEIAKRYQGTHRYRYNGHARTVIVDAVQVYGEGRESLRLLTPEQRRGNVAVHDVGGRTWNVLLFKDGEMKRGRTFDLGMDRLLDMIPAVSGDPAARWSLLGELRKNAKSHPAIRRDLDRAITQAFAIIERKLALPQATLHAVMGGGGFFLPGPAKARYNVPVVVLNADAPEGANALAYARAASEVA